MAAKLLAYGSMTLSCFAMLFSTEGSAPFALVGLAMSLVSVACYLVTRK